MASKTIHSNSTSSHRQITKSPENPATSDWQQFKTRYLVRFWNPVPAVIAAGVLASYYFGITGTFWAVTGEFTRWGGHIMQAFGAEPENWEYFKIIGLQGSPLDRVDGRMIIGMFGGCIAAALWANNIKLRRPLNKIRIVQGLIGGAIAGFGARLAMGCNLAAFFTGIPQFSLHAWWFTLATAVGTYFGARFSLLPVFKSQVHLRKVDRASPIQPQKEQAQRRFRWGILVFMLLCAWTASTMFQAPKLGMAMLFGIGFGLLIERAQICFTSAFRDMWITGRSHLTKAIILGMAVSAIGTYSYIQLGVSPKIMWSGPNAVIGGVLFGFGIVVAGGCETGWMYRAVEGQIHFWWVGAGNIIGSTILAYYWGSFAQPLALSWTKINLLTSLGPVQGLALTYILLALTFACILIIERKFSYSPKNPDASIPSGVNDHAQGLHSELSA